MIGPSTFVLDNACFFEILPVIGICLSQTPCDNITFSRKIATFSRSLLFFPANSQTCTSDDTSRFFWNFIMKAPFHSSRPCSSQFQPIRRIRRDAAAPRPEHGPVTPDETHLNNNYPSPNIERISQL